MNIDKELSGHLIRNEEMWKKWITEGISSEVSLTVNFHFYSSSERNMKLLCDELEKENIKFRVSVTRTLFIFKGWEIEADIIEK